MPPIPPPIPSFHFDAELGRVVFTCACRRPTACGPLPNSVWTIVTLEPLTVRPSIHCSCGVHGFITKGFWVPV